MLLNNTGGSNTAIGTAALVFNDSGDNNTATGAFALYSNTDGQSNTAVGTQALFNTTLGDNNTATGVTALSSNTTGDFNTASGYQALLSNTGGDENTATGAAALQNNSSGSFNTANGRFALINNFTGSFNIALGNFAGEGITSASNVIAIGTAGQNVSNSCYIGNIWNQPGGSQAVYVNSEGKLGQIVSSQRFKAEIKPMEETSEVIYHLKPVSFRYKPEIEPTGPLCFGLIAEEVEEVNSDLVTRGSDGKVNSVRYDAVNAMLLNEFLKEHRKVQELESRLSEQQKQIERLSDGLQKVSAQLEMSRPVPQMAANDR